MKRSNQQLVTFGGLSRMKKASIQDTLEAKRCLREKLLAAWDIHKSNIAYGVETETEEEHSACITWYTALRNLEDWAFKDVPTGVKKHVKA